MSENIPLIIIVTLVVLAALWFMLRPSKTPPSATTVEPQAKPAAPANAIGKPQAADVPTDCFIGNPAQFKNGTVKLPPPIPKIDDARPMPVPAPN